MTEIPKGFFLRSEDWEIWPEEGLLRRRSGSVSGGQPEDGDGPGSQIRLTLQQMSLLRYLLAHRDRVVLKDEIFASIWRDAEVEEVALPRCISDPLH